MTREEFESILEEAFLAGYNDTMDEIFEESSDGTVLYSNSKVTAYKNPDGKVNIKLNLKNNEREKINDYLKKHTVSLKDLEKAANEDTSFDLENEMDSYDESLSLTSKRELDDAAEMMKKKGMSKKGISLNTRMNVAQRAAKVGYYNKDNKNPYISEKSYNKYTNKFIDHLRKNPDDAKKFVQAKTRLDGGSYKQNLERMKSELGL